jgi:hypothetical protein
MSPLFLISCFAKIILKIRHDPGSDPANCPILRIEVTMMHAITAIENKISKEKEVVNCLIFISFGEFD